MSIGDQDQAWAPHEICGSCRCILEGWLRGSARIMPFAIPRVWREPQNHHNDCYFCMINIAKYRKVKGRRTLTYPSIPSFIAPVPHSETLPVPNPPPKVSTFAFINTGCLTAVRIWSISTYYVFVFAAGTWWWMWRLSIKRFFRQWCGICTSNKFKTSFSI